jgi:indole-3-glycerol phosphate synthase
LSDILARLFAAKAAALEAEQQREPYDAVVQKAIARGAQRRSFTDALARAGGPAIVAEIKRASPSVGLIAMNFDPAQIARDYHAAGADAISVLTEADHFLGDLAYLDVARANAACPILRKDFLSTPYQIAQAAAYGADAVLLIAAGLDDATLHTLRAEADRFALSVVVEVHDENELARALAVEPHVLGINNRDLRTFQTDLGTTEYLLPLIPPGVLVMSESGVSAPDDIAWLHGLGARAFLVGEALMRSDQKAAFMQSLKGSVVAG